MKSIPTSMQANLDGRATTHCRIWRVKRQDGVIFGFTDHDRPLVIGGLTYEAATGFTASSIEASLGLAVDNLDVQGALSSASITEDDIARGLWDDAIIEISLVDWSDTDNLVLLLKGNIGEVSRGPTAFNAELRGLSHRLNQPTGRQFDRKCNWDLGDSNCKVALAGWRFSGTVLKVFDARRFTASGLDGQVDKLFQGGLLTWQSGANDTLKMEIKRHSNASGAVSIELSLPMADAIGIDDTFQIQAGCDKTFGTCRSRFSNGNNFGGFPHMPGNDLIIGYADKDDLNDGGSLFNG
ncbi:MAG: DUF2163 domain-containing protein [Roseibium sp.]